MEKVVRAVPIKSKAALRQFAKEVEDWPDEDKDAFLDHFGGAVEEWYYQDIAGKPYIIAVAEGKHLSEGFAQYPDLDEPFFNWFRDKVLDLSGIDLREIPQAAPSEMVYRLAPSKPMPQGMCQRSPWDMLAYTTSEALYAR